MLTQNKNKNTKKCNYTAFSDWNDDSVFTEKKLVVERFGEIIVTLFLNTGASGGVSESVVLPVLAVQRESLSQQIPYNNTNLSWQKQSTHRPLLHKHLDHCATADTQWNTKQISDFIRYCIRFSRLQQSPHFLQHKPLTISPTTRPLSTSHHILYNTNLSPHSPQHKPLTTSPTTQTSHHILYNTNLLLHPLRHKPLTTSPTIQSLTTFPTTRTPHHISRNTNISPHPPHNKPLTTFPTTQTSYHIPHNTTSHHILYSTNLLPHPP